MSKKGRVYQFKRPDFVTAVVSLRQAEVYGRLFARSLWARHARQFWVEQHTDAGKIENAPGAQNMKERQSQKLFSYQGYRAPYQYVAEAKMWEGGIHRGNMFIEFGGDTEQEAEEGFHSLLDSHLKDCAESGEKPELPDEGG